MLVSFLLSMIGTYQGILGAYEALLGCPGSFGEAPLEPWKYMLGRAGFVSSTCSKLWSWRTKPCPDGKECTNRQHCKKMQKLQTLATWHKMKQVLKLSRSSFLAFSDLVVPSDGPRHGLAMDSKPRSLTYARMHAYLHTYIHIQRATLVNFRHI